MYHIKVTVPYRLPLTTLGKVWPWGITAPGHAEDEKGFCCLSYSVHEEVIQDSGDIAFSPSATPKSLTDSIHSTSRSSG